MTKKEPLTPAQRTLRAQIACEIPLADGRVALVDAADYECLMQWAWRESRQGYAIGSQQLARRFGTRFMHRLLMQAPTGTVVHHCNHNKLDNRRANLRLVSQSFNMLEGGPHKRNTSGFRGVFYDKRRHVWYAQVTVDKRRQCLGSFSTAEEAARAYEAARSQSLRGERSVETPLAPDSFPRIVVYANNQSGFRGVTFDTRRSKWRATFRDSHLGYFDDPTEAALIRDAAALRSGRRPLLLNFTEAHHG